MVWKVIFISINISWFNITYLITYTGNKLNKESEGNKIHRSSKYGITN